MKLKYFITACIFSFTVGVYGVDTDKVGVKSAIEENELNILTSGDMINFPIPNQHPGQAYLLKSEEPSNNWLFIYHDRWGLCTDVKEQAYALWQDLENVNVLAIDLFDGKVAKNNAQAIRFLMASQYDRSIAIIKGAIDYIGEDVKIGSLGWSVGGAWSLQTAIQAGAKDVACVVYYGMPEYDVDKLKKLETDVFAVFADKDTWVTPGLVDEFESKMAMAGKDLKEIEYNDVGGFANKSSDKYDDENAVNAYGKVLSYLMTKYE